jgi:hypothetical protein
MRDETRAGDRGYREEGTVTTAAQFVAAIRHIALAGRMAWLRDTRVRGASRPDGIE